MKSIVRFCVPFFFLAGAASAQAPAPKTGPKSQSMTATELVMRLVDKGRVNPNIKQLTPDQVGVLTRIVFYQDRQYPNVYYYTPPLAIADAGSNAFTESLNDSSYEAIRSVHNIVQGNLDAATPEGRAIQLTLFGIDKRSHQTTSDVVTPRFYNDNKPVEDVTVKRALGSLLDISDQGAQDHFVQAVRLAAATAGWPVSGTVKDMNSALQVYASMMASAPVLSVTTPVAFGFDRKTMEAFNALRAGLPEITFYEMSMDPIWRLRRSPFVSDRPPSTATPDSDIFLSNLKVDTNLVLGLENFAISSSGGNLELVMTYPGAIRFGYGQVDRPTDPLKEDSRQNLSYFLPGFLVQEKPLNIAFKGTATCKFKGQVLLDRKVELKKSGGVIVNVNVLDKSSDSGASPEINDCEIIDEKGNAADTSDPIINKLVETYKAKHIEKNLKVYQAALTTKQAMLDKALIDEKALESLPMPKEWKKISTKEKIRVCLQKEREGACINHSRGGWGRRRMCIEHEVIPYEECNDVFTWIDSFAYQPVSTATFANAAEFSRIFDSTDTFAINLTETIPIFPLISNNSVCISRTKTTSTSGTISFLRSGCTAGDANGAALDKGGDKSGDPDKPGLGGGKSEV